jgi:hypothetical protein
VNQQKPIHASYLTEAPDNKKDNKMIQLNGPRLTHIALHEEMNEQRKNLTVNTKVSKQGDASRKETRDK